MPNINDHFNNFDRFLKIKPNTVGFKVCLVFLDMLKGLVERGKNSFTKANLTATGLSIDERCTAHYIFTRPEVSAELATEYKDPKSGKIAYQINLRGNGQCASPSLEDYKFYPYWQFFNKKRGLPIPTIDHAELVYKRRCLLKYTNKLKRDLKACKDDEKANRLREQIKKRLSLLQEYNAQVGQFRASGEYISLNLYGSKNIVKTIKTKANGMQKL